MIYWNPRAILFDIPFVGIPIAWYGVLFAVGFYLGYHAFIRMQSVKMGDKAQVLADKITLYIIIGTILGSRLGHVLFYENAYYYLTHPWLILKTWEGGLASHGGIAGIFVALFAFIRIERTHTWTELVEYLTIPSCIVGAFIRIGNFVNQEILGKPTDMPWSVVFGSPIDHSFGVARHPVQIYEALFYLALGLFLWSLWRKGKGLIAPFFTWMFVFRFLIEFLKEPQSIHYSGEGLVMGQWLSIPFIFLGLAFYVRDYRRAFGDSTI